MSSNYYISQPAAVLRLSGEDHFDFLQSQGTADLRGPAGICRYSLWLDFKGRVLADSFVLKESDQSILLVSYGSPADKLRAKFERHIIADDVEIEDLTRQYELVSFPNAAAAGPVMEQLGIEFPEEGCFSSNNDDVRCFKGRRLGLDTLDILLQASCDIVESAGSMTSGEADAHRLRDSIPLIPADCGEEPVNPLELNILSALSFDKGCYLGQEVVARVHRLQRSSRRLVRIEYPHADKCRLPEQLDDGENNVIRLSSIAQLEGLPVALALLKHKIEDGPLDVNGLSIRVRSVPQS